MWPALAIVLSVAGYQAGKLGAGLTFPDASSEDAAVVAGYGNDNQSEEAVQATTEAVAPIFGVATPDALAPAQVVADIAPNTTYFLQGVTVTGTQRWAMLTSGGPNWLVRPGDTLQTGETVKEITNTTVLLEKQGTLTMLRFSSALEDARMADASEDPALMADLNPQPAEPDTPRVTRIASNPAPEPEAAPVDIAQQPITLRQLRRALYASDALSSVRFERARTVAGGIGWRLKWIADNPLVQAAGLQRGDVLRAINGVEITDAGGLQRLITSLSGIEEIVVLFDRKSISMRAVIPLDRGG